MAAAALEQQRPQRPAEHFGSGGAQHGTTVCGTAPARAGARPHAHAHAHGGCGDGDCPFAALPLNLMELIADRVEPEFRHALRVTCRHARAAVNTTARTLALARHPALARPRDQPLPPAVAAAVRGMFPNVKTLILRDQVADLFGAEGAGCAPSPAAAGASRPRPVAAGPGAGCSPASASSACSSGGGGLGRSASHSSLGGSSTSSEEASSYGSSGSGSGSGSGGRGRGCSGGGAAAARAARGSFLSMKSVASSSCLAGSDGSHCGCGAGGQPAWGSARSCGSADCDGGDDVAAFCRSLAGCPRPNSWIGLERVVLHFEALNDASARQLAASAPGLRELGLTLDLPWQRIRGQARRMAALRHLPCLERVECAAPLGPDALRALRGAVGRRLTGLALDVVPRQHCPGDCLEELCSLCGLTDLTVAYIAGRTLTHGAPLAALTNLRRLAIWVGSYHAAPPWSSRPLPDLLPTVAGLTALSELRLLQGLRRSADVQQLALFTWMPNLVNLGLHDTIVTLEDLMVLARCKALTALSVDGIQLTGSCSGAVMMRRLQSLRVNVMSLGAWSLDELFPGLVQLGPFKDTLGPRGYGVNMPLSVLEGSRRLESLGLMLGGLRGPGARSAADVARVLRTLPALSRLSLIGVAGGFDPTGAGSGGLALTLAEQLARADARPCLRRLELVAWAVGSDDGCGGGCSAEALVSKLRRAAPALEVVVRHEWAG
ncbi:hypothetical protein Rsub_12023 [Raphidocelis subcapitata]|uniref:F-box domain-containing protein n=1 Tax=Raphidocelis subcapitata TaxID=307507 RepID=A0A2V0PH29_9CHLO|nr:hypothetical protein Rsub_12023 [Raphidocelis subcapitata]|eukprot:GBF99131.1 hypothetical protein Rsub_12023 [Raphidocelis subcapitata]